MAAPSVPWNYNQNRPTLGYLAQKLLEAEHHYVSPREKIRAMAADHMATIMKVVEEHEKIFEGDFYVVVFCRDHQDLPGVKRFSIGARKTRPRPHYRQTLYHYDPTNGELRLEYTLPDEATATRLWETRAIQPESKKELLKFIADYRNGELK